MVDTLASGDSGKKLTPRRCCVAHAWISREAYAQLERAAVRRRIHPDKLAAEILDAVLERGAIAQFVGA